MIFLRPVGRSGCVTTPTISKRALLRNASSAGTANSDVPKKIVFMVASSNNVIASESADERGNLLNLATMVIFPRDCFVGFGLLAMTIIFVTFKYQMGLLHHAQLRHIFRFVDKQHAVQVIAFVLKNGGNETLGVHLKRLAFGVRPFTVNELARRTKPQVPGTDKQPSSDGLVVMDRFMISGLMIAIGSSSGGATMMICLSMPICGAANPRPWHHTSCGSCL